MGSCDGWRGRHGQPQGVVLSNLPRSRGEVVLYILAFAVAVAEDLMFEGQDLVLQVGCRILQDLLLLRQLALSPPQVVYEFLGLLATFAGGYAILLAVTLVLLCPT